MQNRKGKGIAVAFVVALTITGVVALLEHTASVSATSAEASATTDAMKPRMENAWKCSNATLSGAYAVKGDGMASAAPPPAPLVPFAVVSLMSMDGAGNLTDKANVSLNGQTASNVNSGTYNIDPDCTGTMTINIPNPPFALHSAIVLSEIEPGRGARGFYFIGTNPGSAVTHVATRVH